MTSLHIQPPVGNVFVLLFLQLSFTLQTLTTGGCFHIYCSKEIRFFFFFKGHPTSRMYDIANSLEADPDPILRVHMCLTLETWSLKCTDTENELYSEAEDILFAAAKE